MVGSYGMAGSLVSFEAIEPTPIGQGIVGKVLANEDARNALEAILDDAKREVRVLLVAHQYLVEALRDALLARDELVGEEILDVIRDAETRHQLDVLDLTELESTETESTEVE
jgi:hypothetical protein